MEMAQDSRPPIYQLLEYKDLEHWMKDNEFILTGYRKASYSFRRSINSVLKLHNETANIFSHLLGASLFAISLYRFQTVVWPQISSAHFGDIAAVSTYYLAVINCLILSSIFHTFSNHSKEMYKFGNELDHLGVVLVIYGSTMPGTYFEFYCHPTLRGFYWALSTTFGIASAIFTLRPKFRQPAYRLVRFYMYAFLGMSTFFPVVHGLFEYGYADTNQRMSLNHFLGLGGLNFAGAAVYAARVPERWMPRRFDIWGSSHQIMHVLVVIGALCFEQGLLQAVRWWNAEGRNTCPAELL
jgi:adiponectin receptor